MIGFLGEKIVLKYEKNRLSNDPDLSQRIEHVSQTKGDGLGYDILSFDSQGNEIFIEVKTTTQGKNSPFYMSSNEVSFANKHPENYFLYRVYNFSNLVEMNNIEFFKINGSQMKNIDLQPANFIANINYIEWLFLKLFEFFFEKTPKNIIFLDNVRYPVTLWLTNDYIKHLWKFEQVAIAKTIDQD